ncbi:hypothetical protein AB1Y20_014733 [Prymnesium parvum]|uniref:Magnesium transporter n=1 Tax=Prymnesium parvum TaxID=97485 RepID=A0AB34IDR5_PRYPA
MASSPPPASPPLPGPADGSVVLQLLGLCLYATSVLMTNVALLIMKRSTTTEKHLPLRLRRTFQLGWLLNLLSEVAFSNMALALAPLAMLAPVAGIGIPAAALFARTGWFGPPEFLSAVEVVGAVITLAGVVLASVYGPKSAGPSLRELTPVFGQPVVLAYFLPQLALTAGWLALMTRQRFARYRPAESSAVKAFVAAYTSGFLIGISYMFFKIFMDTFKALFSGDVAVLGLPLVWICVGLIGPNVVAQVFLMNMCLGSGATNFVVPALTAFNVVMVALTGGVVYKDFENLSTSKIALFFGSIGICILGLVVISFGQATAPPYRLASFPLDSPLERARRRGRSYDLNEDNMIAYKETELTDSAAKLPAVSGDRKTVDSLHETAGARSMSQSVGRSVRSVRSTRLHSISSITYQVWQEVRERDESAARLTQGSVRPYGRSGAFSLCEALTAPARTSFAPDVTPRSRGGAISTPGDARGASAPGAAPSDKL